MLSIHDTAAVAELCRARRIDPHRFKRLRNFFYKQCQGSERALAELPEANREALRQEVEFHPLELAGRHDSVLDGASKLVFRNRVGLLLESIILRLTTGRTALCISTQVGCAANCRFCATGKMGLARNLSAAEILDQVVQAGELVRGEGRRIRNLVLMGMGEPLHNEDEVYRAFELLQAPECFNMSLKRVLVSTVGIPEAMVRCARRFPEVRMALSLHSVRPDVRSRLMPIAHRYSLADLQDALREVAAIQQHEVMIEYLMLAGLNDSLADGEQLADYLAGIAVHINLIPYNPIDGAPDLVGSDLAARQRFAAALKARGLNVTIRYSLGSDIEAACGQLIRRENRHRRHLTP